MNKSVATWNTQGDPFNQTEKTTVLTSLGASFPIILLQECGQLSGTLTGWSAYYGGQAGAFNNRCSTAILTSLPVYGSGLISRSSTGRPGIWIRTDDCIVGTLHSTSGGVGLPDLQVFMQALMDLSDGEVPVIIGGDFNFQLTPGEHTALIGTESRGTEYSLLSQARPTHAGGSILDGFAVCGVSRWDGPRRWGVRPSDHHPVTATFH
jgi:hypothetical protein